MNKLILFFALGAFIMTGCKQDVVDPVDPEDGMQDVTVAFSAQSMLKASTEEDAISKFFLFGLDASNAFVEKYEVPGSDLGSLTDGSGYTFTVLRKIKSFYAIANHPGTLASITAANDAALKELTGSFASAPSSPFLMGGNATIVNGSVTIPMIRAVAKVEFQSTDADLTITSIAVNNTPGSGYVFNQGTAAVPSSSLFTSYAALTGTTVYVGENTVSSPTKFIINGTYTGALPVSYEITLTSGATPLAFARNTHYTVNVTPQTTSDCTVNITVTDWDDATAEGVEVPIDF